MSTWTGIAMLIAGLVLAWMSYRYVRGNPEAFSRANLSKSATTLGILALFLIAFIWLLVLFLRQG